MVSVSLFWSLSQSIACLQVLLILGFADTNMACFVGMPDDAFCYLTRTVVL